MGRTSTLTAVLATMTAVLMLFVLVPAAALGQSTAAMANPFGYSGPHVKVPCGASIQSAISAAPTGATILLATCTYSGALTIDKSLTITGAGAGKTIITSPPSSDPATFGNPWTIVIGDAASVTLSGFTLLVTLQCIVFFAPGFAYAGGGIGVGGSANLTFDSAVVTTTGETEGASCSGGEMSYGTGVGFGLDWVTGSPTASELAGTGTVSGVTISGFGFDGVGVSIGGQFDSSASYALISNDQISTSADDAVGFPAISLGYGSTSNFATIVDNTLSGLLSPECTVLPCALIDVEGGSSASISRNTLTGMTEWVGILVGPGSTASIAHNSILTGLSGFGIELDGGTASIVRNSIVAAEFGWGIVLFGTTATITSNVISGIVGVTSDAGIAMYSSSATITFNSIGVFECEFDPAAAGYNCGPSPVTQINDLGILDFSDAGLGTTIENNLVFQTDIGILLLESMGPCTGCVVKDNLLVNNVDYGLGGLDGDYSFGPNLVVGGLYGVGSIAADIDTTVTLSHVAIVGPSVRSFDIESDYGYVATIVGT
jgi:hypothetical protein